MQLFQRCHNSLELMARFSVCFMIDYLLYGQEISRVGSWLFSMGWMGGLGQGWDLRLPGARAMSLWAEFPGPLSY